MALAAGPFNAIQSTGHRAERVAPPRPAVLAERRAPDAAALNPGTPESAVEPVIDLVDLILVMSVNPGFGGQTFIPSAAEKISRLRALVGARPIDLEVDGGITAAIAPLVARSGANVLVAGSAVLKGGSNYRANIAAIRNAAALARGEAA